MPSFITQSQKDALELVFNDLHDTFKLPLKAYKEQKKIIVSTNPAYNYIYDTPVGTQQKSVVERSFEARIFYLPKGLEKGVTSISDQDALRLILAGHEVRLKVLPEDYEFLKQAERIQIDDNTYMISSAERPHGLFSTRFYTIYLKKAT